VFANGVDFCRRPPRSAQKRFDEGHKNRVNEKSANNFFTKKFIDVEVQVLGRFKKLELFSIVSKKFECDEFRRRQHRGCLAAARRLLPVVATGRDLF
jgi:hypothetical protein